MRIHLYMFIFVGFLNTFFSPLDPLQAQTKRWDGEAGDSLWSNPLNWEGNEIPSAANEVVLDNSLTPNSYVVKLAPGTAGISLKALLISPANTYTISLMIPSENKAVPALSTLAAPGIQLSKGAQLVNASGASSGNVVVVSDSLRIADGGRFIQRSETAHATLLGKLAISPGTEKGIIEFDVPGGASYTVSISNRIYGTVIFSASSAGGQKNYLSSGSGPLLVRGDCVVGQGVTWSLNYSGTCTIAGSTSIAGTWNISSGVHSNAIKMLGNLSCTGKMTETGTGIPSLEFAGVQKQFLSVAGNMQNSIGLHINNSSGVELQTPVTVKGKLKLSKGIVHTGPAQLLILDTGSIVQADSLAVGSFIDGPLSIKGISFQQSTFYPVGKGNTQRWMRLSEFTGDATVEFIKEDPSALSSLKGEGISHISAIEYWKVSAPQMGQGKIELSFDQVNSGGVSDLSALRVAALVNGKWENMGNSSVTGSAGASGSVTSLGMAPLTPTGTYYTLASSVTGVNTLPDDRIDVQIRPAMDGRSLLGKVAATRRFSNWKVEAIQRDQMPVSIYDRKDSMGTDHFSFSYTPTPGQKILYRACAFNTGTPIVCSKWVTYQVHPLPLSTFKIYPNPVVDRLYINVHAENTGALYFELIGPDGRRHAFNRSSVTKGWHTIVMDLHTLLPGPYWLQGHLQGLAMKSQMLIKR